MNEKLMKRIENLKRRLALEEEGCEQSRQSLIKQATKCTAEHIAQGWLDSEINAIVRDVERIQSIRDQIGLLTSLLKEEEE